MLLQTKTLLLLFSDSPKLLFRLKILLLVRTPNCRSSSSRPWRRMASLLINGLLHCNCSMRRIWAAVALVCQVKLVNGAVQMGPRHVIEILQTPALHRVTAVVGLDRPASIEDAVALLIVVVAALQATPTHTVTSEEVVLAVVASNIDSVAPRVDDDVRLLHRRTSPACLHQVLATFRSIVRCLLAISRFSAVLFSWVE